MNDEPTIITRVGRIRTNGVPATTRTYGIYRSSFAKVTGTSVVAHAKDIGIVVLFEALCLSILKSNA